MKLARTLCALLLSMGAAGSALAQAYPAKPVKIISGYVAGGIGSTIAQLFANELGRQLKQTVYVEDKPGASNTISARAAMAARPDGYTLHIGGINAHPLLYKRGVDLSREMVPVATVATMPLVFVTTATQPMKNVAELVAYAKSHPGKLDFASSGGGAQHNLLMALFASRVGISYMHIPFKGTGEIQTAIARGDVHITLLTPPSALPLLASGKAHAVLIGAPERSPLLPNVPTSAEAGLKPFTADTMLVLWAPRGTPRDVIQKLSTAALAVNKDPAYAESLKEKTGSPPMAFTPEQTGQLFASKVEELLEAFQIAKYKPE